MIARSRTAGFVVVAGLAISLMLPSHLLAVVTVDDTDLVDGENSVGGGTAVYCDGTVDMTDVTANLVTTDEDSTFNFNGGNNIASFAATGEAEVTLTFDGENEVGDIVAVDNADLTVHMDENNEFDDIVAADQATLTLVVDGEASCESISGFDEATVTIEGTNCPRKDVLTVGEDDEAGIITTDEGDLTIDSVTVVIEGEDGVVGSEFGDVAILCSKVENADDDGDTFIASGGEMFIGGSVIDIDGQVLANGQLTIQQSDVDVELSDNPDIPYDEYRVYPVSSNTGIELIDEANGEVIETTVDGKTVYYVSTGDDEEDEVHLESAIEPCYYRSCDDDDAGRPCLPRTDDPIDVTGVAGTAAALGAAAVLGGLGLVRRARRSA